MPSVKKLQQAKRRAEVLDLKVAGYSYREIAKRVGISAPSVVRIVRHALDDAAHANLKNAEQLRHLALLRLERLHRELFPRACGVPADDEAGTPAIPPDPEAARVCLSIEREWSLLNGLRTDEAVTRPEPPPTLLYEGLDPLVDFPDPPDVATIDVTPTPLGNGASGSAAITTALVPTHSAPGDNVT